jgi:hypothetical protein
LRTPSSATPKLKRKPLYAFGGVCRNPKKENVMKMIRRFAQVQVLVLSLLSSTVVPMTAHADEVHGKFTLTSQTHWGTTILPAGDYTYSLETRSAMPVVLLRSAKGNASAFIAATSETDTNDRAPNALIIETQGTMRVITELHVNDAGVVLHYKTPATESAAKAAEPKLTAYTGTK